MSSGGAAAEWGATYLRAIRTAIPFATCAAFALAWALVREDFLRDVTVLLGMSGFVGVIYNGLARVRPIGEVLVVSVFVDVLIVAATVQQVPDPEGAAPAFVWSIAVAAVLLRPRVVALATIASVAGYAAVVLAADDVDPATAVTNGLILVVVGVLIAALQAREQLALVRLREVTVQHEVAQAISRTGSWSWDIDRGLVSWTREMYQLLAMPVDTPVTIETFLERIVVDEDRDRVRRAIARTLEDGAPYELDMRLVTHEGDVRVLDVRGDVFEHGGSRLMIGSAQDVTQERELARLQNEFVATASHELRTPTTVVVGFADTLEQRWDELSEGDRRRFLGYIGSSARQLARVVQDVLVSARIESGRLGVELEPLDLVDEVRSFLAPLREVHDEVVVRIAPAAAGVTVRADRVRLCQVIGNLVSNARQHGAGNGPVHVDVAASSTSATVAVRDHGPGIAPGDRDRIFGRFVRLPDASARADGGTGLGLYISREIADAMGGTLTIAPTQGQGATFVLELPLHVPEPA